MAFKNVCGCRVDSCAHTRAKGFLPVIKVFPLCILLLFVVVAGNLCFYAAGCTQRTGQTAEDKSLAGKSAQEVLEEHADQWMSMSGVVGAAIGEYEGKPCILILITKKNAGLAKRIPSQVEGFRVIIKESGEIRASE